MTVRELVEDALRKMGADGLVSSNDDCECMPPRLGCVRGRLFCDMVSCLVARVSVDGDLVPMEECDDRNRVGE